MKAPTLIGLALMPLLLTLNKFDLLIPLHASFSFLYPLKKSKNLWFFGIFRGYGNGLVTRNGLI